jgi:transcriptional regulator with XRE-family HTH domain
LSGSYRAREEFGLRLRRLREEAGLNGKQLAAQLGWAQSKVSRIETGKQEVSTDDVVGWVGTVGAEALVDDLLDELRTVRVEYEAWSRRLRTGLGALQRSGAALDAETSHLRAFEPDIIPGLLQTADYARHVLTAVASLRSRTTLEVIDSVRARMRRQDVLYDTTKRFQFLITEAGLRFHVCPPATLRAQLDRLLAVAGLETIQLAVIPFEAQLPISPSHGFWIFDDRLVQIDTFSAELSLRDADDVALYLELFELLWGVALHGSDAQRLVARIIRQSEDG